MSNTDYKRLNEECISCQAKFDIWISMSNFSLEQEEIIKKSFYHHCPICRIIEKTDRGRISS